GPALQEVPFDLGADEPVDSERGSHMLRLDHLPGIQIGRADIADLAILHEPVQGAQRLLDGRARIRFVVEVEIDVIRVQSAEACLAGAYYMSPRTTPGRRAFLGKHAELGSYDRLVPPAAQGPTQQFLRGPSAIDVGGVEDRDSAVQGGSHDGAC